MTEEKPSKEEIIEIRQQAWNELKEKGNPAEDYWHIQNVIKLAYAKGRQSALKEVRDWARKNARIKYRKDDRIGLYYYTELIEFAEAKQIRRTLGD